MRDVWLTLVCLVVVSQARRIIDQRAEFHGDITQDKEHAFDSLRALTRLLFVSPQTPLPSQRRSPFGNPSALARAPRIPNDQHRIMAPRAAPQAAMSAASVELQAPKTNRVTRSVVGLAFMMSCLGSVLAVYPLLLCTLCWSLAFDNARRRGCDRIVQIWAKLTLKLIGSKVTVEGIENLPPPSEAVLYAPNHNSFLDIFSLSGFLPRRFKYVSKIEILRIPLIGWAMKFAKHIAIRRSDRASQLKTFKDAVACLEAGSSLVTFPEGTRSKDGRLLDFKGGPFTMARRAGKRVVPITIVGTHLFQPPGAFVPFAVPRGVRIVVHPPIDVEDSKEGERKALNATRSAIMSALPPSMLPA